MSNIFKYKCSHDWSEKVKLLEDIKQQIFPDCKFTYTDLEHYTASNNHKTHNPFSVRFANEPGPGNLLCFCDESGCLKISRDSFVDRVAVHTNSIFDAVWFDRDRKIVTASADHTAVVTDTISGYKSIAKLSLHFGSIRSVSPCPSNFNLISTCARDGNIHLWDLRVPYKPTMNTALPHRYLFPTSSLLFSHYKKLPNKRKRRVQWRDYSKLDGNSLPDLSHSTKGYCHSVSSVNFAFNDSTYLVSSGTVDGTVKIWDLRKISSSKSPCFLEVPFYRCPESKADSSHDSNNESNLDSVIYCTVSLSGDKMAVITKNDRCYFCRINVVNPSSENFVQKAFSGLKSDSFYIKASFSPDGNFIVTGSTDSDIYIFSIKSGLTKKLQGHSSEVSGVDWCKYDFSKIASCSDDHTIKLWSSRLP